MINLLYFLTVTLALAVALPHHGESEGVTEVPKTEVAETVKVQLYYESLCPDCIAEYPQLPPLVNKLGARVELHTYPYGNARMRNESGTLTVKCQHGEAECYGNKLHACAIDYLKHKPSAYVPYNACLMSHRSNDTAADSCAQTQNIDSAPIKTCAKGQKGEDLLLWYGKESQKVTYPGVPYVLINGNPKPEDQDLMAAVCQAFKNPPDVCNKISPSSSESSSNEI